MFRIVLPSLSLAEHYTTYTDLITISSDTASINLFTAENWHNNPTPLRLEQLSQLFQHFDLLFASTTRNGRRYDWKKEDRPVTTTVRLLLSISRPVEESCRSVSGCYFEPGPGESGSPP